MAEKGGKGKEKKTYLFKCNTEINVNDLACAAVYKDIRYMPVSQTKDVPDDGCSCNAPRIIKSHGKP